MHAMEVITACMLWRLYRQAFYGGYNGMHAMEAITACMLWRL